jgi:hypothetical protein
MTQKTFKPKYVDEKLDIKLQWKIFCRKLYARVLETERQEEQNYIKHIKNEVPYQERVKRLKQCEKYKKIIQKSANKTGFNIQDGDSEIILDKGFEYYFKYINGELIYD